MLFESSQSLYLLNFRKQLYNLSKSEAIHKEENTFMLEKVDNYEREKLAMNKRHCELEKHLSEVLTLYGKSKTIVDCYEVHTVSFD